MRPPELFVPASPTLSPSMLLRRPRRAAALPFPAARVSYFYFARNALSRLVGLLGLEGREVLLPAYHHGVEVDAFVEAGARVAFYRIGPRMEPDLDDLDRRIGPRTGALHLTHFLGFPGPAREARAIADRHGLYLIEDCAHALLTLDDNAQPLGRSGHVAVFCLYKGVALPHGGALVINDHALADVASPPAPPFVNTVAALSISLLRRLALRGGAPGRALRRLATRSARAAGLAPDLDAARAGSERFDPRHRDLGISRLALRLARSHDLERTRERQRENYLFLSGELADLAPPLLPEPGPGVVPFFFPLTVSDNRAAAQQLARRGIEAVDFWRASHPACDLQQFSDVARLRRTVLELPCHPDLDRQTMARYAEVVRNELSRAALRAA